MRRQVASRTSELGSDDGFLFVGNSLCLDFVNTALMQAGQPLDLMSDPGKLMVWLVQAKILDEKQRGAIDAAWKGSPELECVFRCALEFRAGLRDMAGRIVAGKPVPPAMVAQINGWLGKHTGRVELKKISSGFEKRFQADFEEPAQLLWPIAESACDLLCYADLALVKKCENAACVLFFYDTTKNHSRRWCSMNICGNRMKVAAHYQRQRSRKGSGSDG